MKQAFGENKDEKQQQQNIREISDTHETSLTNPSSEKIGHDFLELDRFYDRAFFTINDATVEVILDNDVLSWSTISGESLLNVLFY